MTESNLTSRRLFLRAGIAAGAGACVRTAASAQPAPGPGREDREGLRIGFMTDMQFDGPPKQGNRFGLAEQGNPNKAEGYNIALFAWQAMMEIQPDFIFDAGDLTADGEEEEFLVMHYPLNNTTTFSDKWWRTNHPAWKRTSNEIKALLTAYQDDVVAVISGHVHMQWDWRDTPDDKWDRKGETENVGFFVDGRKINSEEREHEPRQLPEVHFLNLQALDWPHGPAREPTVHYTDARPGSRDIELRTMRIEDRRIVDRYPIRPPHPVDVGDGKLHFMESDLAIFEKDLTVRIEEDDWFLIPKGGKGVVGFQQQWAEPVKIPGVTVETDGGKPARVLYKTADHPLGDWTDYQKKLPQAATSLRVRIEFEADEKAPMRVHDVKVDTE